MRVVRLTSRWDADDQWVVGTEGITDSYVGANRDGTGWQLAVSIPDREGGEPSLWVFEECELESLGLVQHETEDGHGPRVPIDGNEEIEELEDAVQMRLMTQVTDEAEANRVVVRTTAELRARTDARNIAVRAERHWHEPFSFDLHVDIVPDGDSLAAFDAIVAGHIGAVDDDGWSCGFAWTDSDAPGETFLVPEIDYAEVHALPWSSPSRRPASERRTSELRPPWETKLPRAPD